MIGVVYLPAAQTAGAQQAEDFLLLAFGVLPDDQQRGPLQLPQFGAHHPLETRELLLQAGLDGRPAFPNGGVVHVKLRVLGKEGGGSRGVADIEGCGQAPKRDAARVAGEE